MLNDIRCWETEYGDIVVWGTHFPGEAYTAYRAMMEENCPDMPQDEILALGDFREFKPRWAHPFMLDEEDWSEHPYRISQWRHNGWVPFMVIDL